MVSSVIDALSRLFACPHDANRAWKARTGGKVVGFLGRDVPVEMIAAAGMLPVEILGHQGGGADAIGRFLPDSFVEPALRSLASRLIDGTYDYVDYLVISPKPAVNVTLFEFQREAKRVFDDLAFPEAYFLDFFHSPRLTASLFNRDSLRRLLKQLEQWAGSTVTDKDLRAKIGEYNARRRRLTQILEMSRGTSRRISGSQALAIANAFYAAPFEDLDPLLDALLADAASFPLIGGVPVIYSGSSTTDVAPYEAIEAGGALIVADDQDCGAMSVEWLIDEQVDPIDALADRGQFVLPDALRQNAERRSDHLMDLARRTGARAVLFHILAIDHAAMLDYPRVRDCLETNGIVTAEFGARMYNDRDFGPLTAKTVETVARINHGLDA